MDKRKRVWERDRKRLGREVGRYGKSNVLGLIKGKRRGREDERLLLIVLEDGVCEEINGFSI